MARAALFALVIASAPLSETCAKLRGLRTDDPPRSSTSAEPPALPLTSATAPPIWTAPEPAPSGAAPTANPDLAKAHAAGDHKKVRALLEKRVKTGKATREEAAMLLEACTSLRDKLCIDLVKTKYPD